MAWQKTDDVLVNEERYTDPSGSKWRTGTRNKKRDPVCSLIRSSDPFSQKRHITIHCTNRKQRKEMSSDAGPKIGTSGKATRATIMDGPDAAHHDGSKERGGRGRGG